MRMLVAAGPVVLSAHTLPSRERLDKNNSLRHMTRMMPTLRIGPLDRTQMTVNHQLRCRATGGRFNNSALKQCDIGEGRDRIGGAPTQYLSAVHVAN